MSVVYVVRYERCRSSRGVPVAMVPVTTVMVELEQAVIEMEVIRQCLHSFSPLARRAHAGTPSMWMPSDDPARYLLAIESQRTVFGTLQIDAVLCDAVG